MYLFLFVNRFISISCQKTRLQEEWDSDHWESTKMAKICAAFKACKRLYEEGELNDQLLPVTTTDCIKSISNDLFKHWKKYDDNVTNKKVGKAKRRLYKRTCPIELYNAMPILGEKCYIYEITIDPEFEINEYNAHLIHALKSKSNYAILLRNKLPKLASMPLFMSQGPLKVHIAERPLELIISTNECLQQLKKYHIMIVRDILECWRSYYVIDPRNKDNSFLIVPISNGSIDWNVVERFERLEPFRKPTLDERQKSVYKPEEWLGKVVGKWYSTNTQERFVVTKVLTDETPLSILDFKTGETYLHFFETRYRSAVERILNHQQFLIEVKSLTSRRNFFNNAKSKNSVIKRDTLKVLLVPELCHNFKHPGDLWLKAFFLPSVLHRLHYMLHAEHIRRNVNAFLGLDRIFSDYRPKPLIIDQSLRRVSDVDGNACDPIEENTVLLAPMTPSKNEKVTSGKYSLVSAVELWKEYMEPINICGQSNSIYSAELEYYSKFMKNFEEKFTLIDKSFDYKNPQLLMPSDFNDPITDCRPTQVNKLAINEAPLETKSRIAILERSFSKQSSNEILCAEQFEFLAALTAASSNDVFDMERFELLGDSFLKFAISLFLANKYPHWHEGFLTEVKSKLVSNRNLLYCLLKTDIPTRICSNLFTIHEWLPPLVSLPVNILEAMENEPQMRILISARDLNNIELSESEILTGRCSQDHFSQLQNSYNRQTPVLSNVLDIELDSDLNYCTYKDVRSDKVIADTVEALLGVCVKNYGIHRGFQMLEYFGCLQPDKTDKPLNNLLDLELGGSFLRANLDLREVDGFLINYQYLERNLGYKFRNRAYLLQALTHPSYPTNRLTGCYQQLEFIGDAILDFVISCYIFERHESKNPGMLTDMRSALVNNVILGCVCVRHRFHLFLLAENAVLAESIKTFAEFQESQKCRVTDLVRILLEEGDCSKILQQPNGIKANISVNIEVPKVLGDIVEALVAAVYLDSRSLKETWNVIYHLLEWELIEFDNKVPIDAVRQLYEHQSAKPTFSDAITDNDVTMVKCIFSCLNRTCEVNGFGTNKTQAKKSAAKHALQILAKAMQ